ncbi:SapC family protein [Ruegeria sp. THAF57]|uniref:SapC family protein n=1 Tax=Ruegeria sp. THAF57 TaxID=2744555 RepID=UPI0015DE597B|nr:SapC family protein [Ruegeria sp. THAF57]
MEQNQLQPVSFARHKNWRWKRFTSYRFATQKTQSRIVMTEASEIAAAFPIIFQETDLGIEPKALFSLQKKAPNPFVTTDGRWLASYVPAELRCPPFQLARTEYSSHDRHHNVQLLVDETSALLTTQPEDEPFFSDNDELSQNLQDVLRFCSHGPQTTKRRSMLVVDWRRWGYSKPLATTAASNCPPARWQSRRIDWMH